MSKYVKLKNSILKVSETHDSYEKNSTIVFLESAILNDDFEILKLGRYTAIEVNLIEYNKAIKLHTLEDLSEIERMCKNKIIESRNYFLSVNEYCKISDKELLARDFIVDYYNITTTVYELIVK